MDSCDGQEEVQRLDGCSGYDCNSSSVTGWLCSPSYLMSITLSRLEAIFWTCTQRQRISPRRTEKCLSLVPSPGVVYISHSPVSWQGMWTHGICNNTARSHACTIGAVRNVFPNGAPHPQPWCPNLEEGRGTHWGFPRRFFCPYFRHRSTFPRG